MTVFKICAALEWQQLRLGKKQKRDRTAAQLLLNVKSYFSKTMLLSLW